MKLFYIFILIVGLGLHTLEANNRLTSGFEYLRTDFSPRTTAMSGAFVAVNGDLSAMFVNPAGLASVNQKQFTFNYTNYLLDISGGMAAYAQRFESLGVLSIGLVYMNYGEFQQTDEDANLMGNTFSANDIALGLGIANHLDDHFSYGLNLKYAFSQIHDYNASAVALDFGLIYAAPFEENLNIALSVTNIGSNIKYYESTKEALPLNISLGFSKILAHLPLEIAASLNNINVQADDLVGRIKRFSIGGEFRLSELLRLRLGYNNGLNRNFAETGNEKFGGISGGLGIYWKNLRFDYAYSSFSLLGGVHRFGITGSLD
jgi:hypothetical protein